MPEITHGDLYDCIEKLEQQNAWFREALEGIAALPQSTTSGDMNFARMLATNALTRTQPQQEER